MIKRFLARPLSIFLLTLLVFMMAPVYQSLDSRYSLMVSQNLIERGSFALDNIPGLAEQFPYYKAKSNFEVVDDKLFYLFPNASSLLSVPYVATMNLFGFSVINTDGSFNTEIEVRLQRGLASLLMAALSAIIFLTARLVLPLGWSWLVALTAAFGTQILSTATRGLWSHTWGILLLGTAIYLLVRHLRGLNLNPYLFATLLSWAYMVRPTFCVSIVVITVYVLLTIREAFLRYAATGAFWLTLFIGYSWHTYGKLLPNYFAGGRLGSGTFWTAVAGNLVSPARGVLIYSPFIVVVIILVVLYRRVLKSQLLAVHAGVAIVLHLMIISTFPHWWAGHSYGPRLMTDVVPWFMLLAILGLDAVISAHVGVVRSASTGTINSRGTFFGVVAVILVLFSVFTHVQGAFNSGCHIWSLKPNIDQFHERLWDWRNPQFMGKFDNE